MNRHHHINKRLDWKSFIPKIEPNTISLQLRDDDNFILAWGVNSSFVNESIDFDSFQHYKDLNRTEYIFGFFGYDVKNAIEPNLTSKNKNYTNLPDCFFFTATNILINLNGHLTYVGDLTKDEINELIDSSEVKTDFSSPKINLKPLTTKQEYLKCIEKIQTYLLKGEIYEINYCQTFQANFETIDSFSTFLRLKANSNAPFTTFFTFDNYAILSFSPERFLTKNKTKLTSQPIKGTAPRSSDPIVDNNYINKLIASDKERAENIMIVDLVRNDLSKIALKNSVTVEELVKLFSFKNVHQLISTISCTIHNNTTESQIIHSLFPMGSMTGAPKYKAMEIAEELETFKRGIYSGTIGYFSPNGDFDFNVIIRTAILDALNKIISVSVGGAITIKSVPEDEYSECLLKLDSIQRSLC